MNRKIRKVSMDHFLELLRSLGYYEVGVKGRRAEWRRGKFHLHTYSWAKKGLELRLHEDIWKSGTPVFRHKSRSEGKDLERELDRIEERYRERSKAT